MKIIHAMPLVAGVFVVSVAAQENIAFSPAGIGEDLWIAGNSPKTSISPTRPALGKVEGYPADKDPAMVVQGTANLEPRKFSAAQADVFSEDEITAGRKYSPPRPSELDITVGDATSESAKKNLVILAGTYRNPGEREVDCQKIYHSVGHQIKFNEENVLEIVSLEIMTNPACACEIVKAAIGANPLDADGVAAIAEAAMIAAPESMRIISQCVIASAPESLPKIQAILARLDPNAGEAASAKSSKQEVVTGEHVAAIRDNELPNPLNRFHFSNPLPPLPLIPTPVTNVDP